MIEKEMIDFNSLHSVYQPIVDIEKNRIVGYEALIRGKGKWANPEKLFHYAYEKGFVIPLDLECIHKALDILPALSLGQMLFVNIEPITLSSHLFRQSDFGKLLQGIQKKKPVVFELTEGMKSRSIPLIQKGVQMLRRWDCQLALDDVRGIGVKFLELLKLKPDYIKIDRSIVQGLSKNSFLQRMVREIVGVSQGYDAHLIAEGVENLHDLNLLKRMKIRFSQGFYYAKPEKELKKILAAKTPNGLFKPEAGQNFRRYKLSFDAENDYGSRK
ncbi:MAG: EAL domain-containing protein [Candidatus Omnitrophica bacterium]|nr:EAL domain-containing protein [Candidatus Omnitrophota bacterium]